MIKFANSRTWAGVCLLTATSGLWATQHTPVEVSIESNLVLRGNSSLHLVNNTREIQYLTLSPGAPGTIRFAEQRAAIRGGGAIDVNLGQLEIQPGNQILHVVSMVTMGTGQVAGPSLHEVLMVDRTGIVKTTYEQAYLDRRISFPGESRPTPMDIGGGYMDAQPMARLAWPSDELPPDTVVGRTDAPSTFELSNIRLKQLPETGGASDSSRGALIGLLNRPGALEMSMQAAKQATHAPQAGAFGSIKGHLAVKLPNPTGSGPSVFQSAWGWKVRAWQLIGSTWLQVGGTSVAGDGTWNVDFNFPPFAGFPVQVEYQPANRFLQVQDANANIYSWSDSWSLTGALTNIGNRFVNLTVSGAAPGIDAIYQGGTALWRKFKAYGMNALRDKPIEITYPNTLATGMCPSTDNANKTIPWSCSYSDDGKIWLIQKHAVPGVVQHEIAHSIHSFYWDGNMPSGGGGKHNLNQCFNGGLALAEGFADFMPYWVQFNRSTNNPVETTLGLKIDQLGSGFCAGSSNESRVAATFWDVYDSVNDGASPIADTWYFSNAYAPVSTFLNNSGHNSMFEYNSVYTSILGANWSAPVTNLFLLNTTIFP
jgi:hypothetical protein